MGGFLDEFSIESLFRCRKVPDRSRVPYYTEPRGVGARLASTFEDLSTLRPDNPYALLPNYIQNIEIPYGRGDKQVREVNLSPQVRKIPPSSNLYIPIVVVPRNTIFELTDYSWEYFTCQGAQDIIVRLFLGDDSVFQSGKVDSVATVPPFDDPVLVTETRTTGIVGVPPSTISSTSGIGFPDNYWVYESGNAGMAREQETVYFLVSNQSSVYNHGLRIYIRGIAYPVPTQEQ